MTLHHNVQIPLPYIDPMFLLSLEHGTQSNS
jgi:hypothetical protein